jgi:tetratricopeptide (TPR) repeat protein
MFLGRILVLSLVIGGGTGLRAAPDPSSPPPAGRKKQGAKITEVGAADAREVGKLPALTSELAQRAAAAVSRRDWKEARDAYLAMVEAGPDNPLALANLGAVEYQLKDFDAAIEHLEGALRQRPNLAQTWLTLGMVHYQRDENHLALSAISRAIAEKPDDPRSHNYLAAVVKALGWTAAAESELQKALDLDNNYAEGHFNLALIYLERKPPAIEMARRHYLRALELGTQKDELVEKQLKESTAEESLAPEASESAAPPPPATPAVGVEDENQTSRKSKPKSKNKR